MFPEKRVGVGAVVLVTGAKFPVRYLQHDQYSGLCCRMGSKSLRVAGSLLRLRPSVGRHAEVSGACALISCEQRQWTRVQP